MTRKLSPLPQLPPLHILLIGGVASGKGTVAPMLSQAFGVRAMGVGALLRGEARAGRRRGLEASEAMAQGKLLDDELVLGLLEERLGSSTDIALNGWLLDGFPRSVSQAEALLAREALRPDAVVLIERPDELVREFALGRCCDTATGQTYHPIYAPPPSDIQDRLVWRIDDTYDSLRRRMAEHEQSVGGIIETFETAGVPLRRVSNARSEVDTFAEIADFLSVVAMDRLSSPRPQELRAQGLAAEEQTDVPTYCHLDESEEDCIVCE